MLQLFNQKVVCLRCDGNGLIYKALIVSLKIEIFVCDECEATWQTMSDIYKNNFVDLPTFLEKKGLVYGKSKIIDLGYDWYRSNHNS